MAQVIRKRLFSYIEENSAKEVVDEFLDYAEREGFLQGIYKTSYRERFLRSYPFQPEVIDVLYERWGALPTFQRTRGVLRLLALVVYSLKDKNIPFIRLCNFDLKNENIRRELIKHIGQEYDSVIASDITSPDSGAKVVDKSIGPSYVGYRFGTRVATTIFMYSFPEEGSKRGTNVNEIKLSCAEIGVPSSVVVEAIDKLKESLFYLSDDGLYFTKVPNLNRIILNKTESIQPQTLEEEEEKLLKEEVERGLNLQIYIWPDSSKDIPDNTRLKFVVLKDRAKAEEFKDKCGEKPRVYRNTLIFLCPSESEKIRFENTLKELIACQEIEEDKTLQLTDEQRKKIKEKIKGAQQWLKEELKNLYRIALLPTKDGLEETDLGRSAYGVDTSLYKRVYERFKEEGKILERMSPLVIKDRYLKDKDYVETKGILESIYSTPGELRIVSEEVLKEAIEEGVKQGLFGLGFLEGDQPACEAFGQVCAPKLEDGEIIIRSDLCLLPKIEETIEEKSQSSPIMEEKGQVSEDLSLKQISQEAYERTQKTIKEIHLKLNAPAEQLSTINRSLSTLINKGFNVDIRIEMRAHGGEILKSEYEDRIKETFIQEKINIEDERYE